MRVTGDPEGVAVLKALVAEHRDYMKFLITEAQSASDHVAPFKAGDGTAWQLVLHVASGELEVRRHAGGSPPC